VVRSPAITRTISCCELVMTSDGRGCHKSWLQQLEPESSGILRVSYELVTWTVPVTREYSGRAAVFREELQLQ
jgi:hypothetical protein